MDSASGTPDWDDPDPFENYDPPLVEEWDQPRPYSITTFVIGFSVIAFYAVALAIFLAMTRFAVGWP